MNRTGRLRLVAVVGIGWGVTIVLAVGYVYSGGLTRQPVVDIFREKSTQLTFVLIPEGDFISTIPAESRKLQWDIPKSVVARDGRELAVMTSYCGKASIDRPFYISTTEVTNRAFLTFVEETDYRAPEGLEYPFLHQFDEAGDLTAFSGPDQPVICVNMEDAEAFCAWLSRKLGRRVRLPTAVELQYVAFAGREDDGSGWHNADWCQWGGAPLEIDWSDVDEIAWYRDNSSGVTHEVGMKRPNVFGVFDALGNVREWTSTPSHDTRNEWLAWPDLPEEGWFMTVGGSYLSEAHHLLAPYSHSTDYRTGRWGCLGFRVVCEIGR